jgi:hypothetical protein
MAVYKRGGVWWYSFIYAGKRVQESAKTSRKTLAVEAERARRLELERALAGLPTEARERRIRSVGEVLDSYAADYGLNHRPRTTIWVKGCVAHVKKHLGALLLPDLTEDALRRFIKVRLEEGACGRTVNMEIWIWGRSVAPWGSRGGSYGRTSVSSKSEKTWAGRSRQMRRRGCSMRYQHSVLF